MGLPCRPRVNYRGYAMAVHRRLCYPHVMALYQRATREIQNSLSPYSLERVLKSDAEIDGGPESISPLSQNPDRLELRGASGRTSLKARARLGLTHPSGDAPRAEGGLPQASAGLPRAVPDLRDAPATSPASVPARAGSLLLLYAWSAPQENLLQGRSASR